MMKIILKNKFNIILIILFVLVVFGGVLGFRKMTASSISQNQTPEEIELSFDPEGPYALLFPRRDGNAVILNLKRTASYDGINYELSYVSEGDYGDYGDGDGGAVGIDRGVMGEINTQERKGEYEQEILFGTCSKNVCKYDKGVEYGTLNLNIKKGNKVYRIRTQWHIQKPDFALGILASADNHFIYKINPKSTDLSLVQYTIINNLSGAPKLPSGKNVIGKVYAINTPVAKELPGGTVSVEVAEDIPSGSKIAYYSEAKGRWVELETKITGSKLEAVSPEGGIFAILH